MKLTLIRHGETNYNKQNLISAKTGTHVFLTEKGIQQAQQAAKELEGEHFDAIFVSEMYRTLQTAAIINDTHQHIPIVDSRLNENYSANEDKNLDDVREENENREDWFTYRHLDGESLFDVYKRVEEFLSELRTKPFKQVLIVTHECIIKFIYAYINNIFLETKHGNYTLRTAKLLR